MSSPTRVPLYDRLPEIYRLRDAEQFPADQLKSYLAAVESAFGAIHENIEQLYHDFFIETSDAWVIPYIADLLGTSHLKGDPWTLRADVADTVMLRRRKGTRAAIERLAANLTQWAARAVELRENLGWTQHLNHQRPDAGGTPPYSRTTLTRFDVPRGGTVPVRDPAMLSLIGTPFDPFAYTADVKRADDGAVHINLPNLAIFLWRLEAYTLPLTRPLPQAAVADLTTLVPAPIAGEARFAIGFDFDALDRGIRLFNTWQYDPDREPPVLTAADGVPGPIPDARLTTGSAAGNPAGYVSLDLYTPPATTASTDLQQGETGLTLFLPNDFAGNTWTFRGDNLCAWQAGLRRRLRDREIVIDPDIGRVLFGVNNNAEATRLRDTLLASYTYGAVGPIGAQPIGRDTPSAPFDGSTIIRVSGLPGGTTLTQAIASASLNTAGSPVVIEIGDSLVHELDPAAAALGTLRVSDATIDNGLSSWRLGRSLLIRAASDQRPVVRLSRPLRFRPLDPAAPAVADLQIRIEGIYLTRAAAFPAGLALIERAAVARLELISCTLDPGGHRLRGGTRAPLAEPALRLNRHYGFTSGSTAEDDFAPTPDVLVQRSTTGALLIDDAYTLTLADSVIDAGAGVGLDSTNRFALAAATDTTTAWACPLDLRGATFFGRTRIEEGRGFGGIFVHALEVHNNQTGCLKFSYFADETNRLPPNHACVHGDDARLVFTSEWHGEPGYAQLRRTADWRIRERGPGDDAMGATGFLLEAHKWANLSIRLREFMPIGVRPLLIPVT